MAKHESPDVRRSQLFAAAFAVCAEKGYHATTVEDIAERAGLSKGAVYHHFKSKRDLFVSLLETSMDEFTTMIDALEPGASATAALREVIVSGLRAFPPALRQGLAEFYQLGMREPSIAERFRRHYDEMIAAGARLIRSGIQRGELRADLDPERAARLFFIGADGLVFMYLVIGDNERSDQAVLDFVDIVLDGFRAPSRGRRTGVK